MNARLAISLIAMAISSCGGTVAESTLPVASSSTVPPATIATSSTATASPATTSSTSFAAGAVQPVEIPRLENGLPATFVGVTEDSEAVEVDTATGAVIRSIGRLEPPNETDDEAGAFNAIQQVWRTSDHLWFIVSECCEPAAGMILYLDPETVVTDANHFDNVISDGWTVAPSPFDGRLAKLGYDAEVFAVGTEPELEMWLDEDNEVSSAMTVAAWGADGASVSWLSLDWESATTRLVHLDITEPDSRAAPIALKWLGPDQWLDGMGTQESGNLVAFMNTPDRDPETSGIAATDGVVFSAEGELLATFAVQTGSLWGGYDPSGRFLIYTDGDDIVRWQGLGRSGILAEGFIHASW